ncbi:DUF1998 domain-containing protein [Coleofasciculus sp. FACHB-SPT36]|uniref:DUF1998 domain-containing protein n=1 Tax=Coleofasciculus sp. FACHB-SPT36 TaxID=2692790 RepID=UPI00168A72C3|nr:DUF1998 domain-containing protein [Coleofasciculus sp. FACHB-SPT36]MBD2541475.1 DUF1998 domain-containing protein [Coleofasciculus sp. FACHB-SPT36]
MKSKAKRPPSGEIRQSQILSTFGPGAMVDLPDYSVLIGGLNHWKGDRRRIYEDRLAARVSEILGVNSIAMYAPPVDAPDPAAPRTGITAFTFPAWFVAQVEETWTAPSGKEYRTRPLIPWGRLVKGKYLDSEKKKKPVVPVRFVQACLNGHISDVDWYLFANPKCQSNCPAQLWLDEGGSGNDFADIFVRCEQCKERRPLSDATLPGRKALGSCKGERPWLGPNAADSCVSTTTGKQEANRLLVRSASNAYFAQTLSVISLPDSDEALRQAVNLVYEDFLQYAEDLRDVQKERKKQKVFNALEGFSDETVWAEIQRRQVGQFEKPKSIKQVEIETLLSSPSEVGEDAPEGDFYARARKLDNLSSTWQSQIERIVLVHCLREVIAQVGFTRFEAAMPDIDGELSLEVRRAALDIEPTWVPAVENKGEGVFIAFRKQAIEDWRKQESVQHRGQELFSGFNQWCKQRGIPDDKAKFPGLPYIMLHSLSHLLITAVSLECGYAASSIRERIYAGESGYGILLYTGTSGSEGTLGGLVQVGRQIESHLATALELGRLCSNDPVCAQHKPDNVQEERFLHGSACHGCLLIAETSCERRNEFLDRALVVNTVDGLGAAFFPDEIL